MDHLGLVLVDEQHKFGVAQREQLVRKGNYPHLLVMTATPIPRTLALTVYGDLDVTTLDEMPPGREPAEERDRVDPEHLGAIAALLDRDHRHPEPAEALADRREVGRDEGRPPDEAAVETCEEEVAHRLPAVGRGALGGADHDDAARGEQPTEVHQVIMAVTPRFSSARRPGVVFRVDAMITPMPLTAST